MINDLFNPLFQKHVGNVANIPSDYRNPRRNIKPAGLVYRSDKLFLKLYDMYIVGQPTSKEKIEACKNFIRSEIADGSIEPYLGLGFAILSKDMLNVARWDTKYPIVLQNQIYGFEEEYLSDAKQLDIKTDGSFCVWELGVVNYERKQWIDFLSSERTTADKIKYLASTWKSK